METRRMGGSGYKVSYHSMTRLTVLLLLLGTLAVDLVAPVVAWQWIRHPFPGFFLEHTLVISDVMGQDWDTSFRSDALWRLTEIEGQPVESGRDVRQWMDLASPGDVLDVTLAARPDSGGGVQTRPITVQTFPVRDWITLFWLPYGIALVYLIIGGWVFFHRGDRATGQSFALFCAAVTLGVSLLFDADTTHLFSRVWTAALPLAAASLIHLALVFPERGPFVNRWPTIRFVPYALAAPVILISQIRLYSPTDPWAYITPWRWSYAALGAAVVVFFLIMLYTRVHSISEVTRRQVRIILVGALLSFAPITIYFILAGVPVTISFQPTLYMPPLIIFPLFVAYAILRYKLLGMDLFITRGLAYSILTAGVVGIYAFVALVLGQTIGFEIQGEPVALVLAIIVLLFVLNPLREGVERMVDRLLDRQRLDYRQLLEQFSRDLVTTPLELPDILDRLLAQIDPVVHSAPALVFLHDPLSDRYLLQMARNYVAPDDRDTSFPGDTPLATRLIKKGGPLYLIDTGGAMLFPVPPTPEEEQAQALGLVLYLPMRGKRDSDRLTGYMALGPRLSGEPYIPDDLTFLAAVVDQATIAIENARLVDNLEQQVVRLDVLRKIGEAVDLRKELEDLLDLIYEQMCLILKVDNFYVALYDPVRRQFEMAYYVEEGVRREPDNKIWPLGTGLTSQIVRTGEPIVTADYISECERRGLPFGGRPAKAWLGMPLGASGRSGRVLGVLNISSFRRDYRYTDEQVQIVRAVSDQAAVAIDRMRLYREMEVRAAELATLNEVGRTINSTLDLPSVLDMIMNKVLGLLDVEAASLLLVDDESGDLVFQVVLGGPDSQALIGRHLPAGQGIVGLVAESGQAQIVNNVQTDPRWDRRVDMDSGFITRSVLCVPMIHRGRIVGVIEVINHRDESPFQADEAHLLTSFAAQAAVAIENARLYTQTDQALARRVEELSTMQAIDRELNAALDFDLVMDMTLEWAMRQTGAPAGVMAEVDEEQGGLLLLACRGYPPGFFERYKEELWPLDLGIVSRVLRTGEPILVADVSQDPDYAAALPSTNAQLSVPIKREGRVVAMINLESPELGKFDQEDLAFVERLATHAAVAIENARLHAETKRRLEEQVALRAAGEAISAELDLRVVLNRIAEEMARAVDATSAYICDYQAEADSASVLAEYISPHAAAAERISDLGMTYFDIGQEFWERLRDCGFDVGHIDDPDLDDSEREHMLTYGAQTVLYIPFQLRDKVVGFVELWESRRRRRFTRDEISLCQGIAQQAAIAMENARLYQESRRRAEDMSLLYEIGLTVNAHLALDQVLEAVYMGIRVVWDPPVFLVGLYDEEKDDLDFRIYVERGQRQPPFRQPVVAESSLMSWIVRNRQSLLIRDWDAEMGDIPVTGILIGSPTKSWLGVPLVAGSRLVGVLSVQDYQPRAFGQDHERFLSTIASEVAIAIENARLYQQTEQYARENERLYQEVERRLREMTLLFDTSVAVSRSLDLERVLHTTAEHVTRALDADGCTIATWEHEDDVLLTRLSYAVDSDRWQPGETGTTHPLAENPALRALLDAGQPVQIPAPEGGYDPAVLAWGAPGPVESAMIVPMVVRDKTIGLLALVQAHEQRAFTPTEIQLCQTLANQAAAAIENARLYEGVKEADHAKSEFIDFVAHELKQPMTAMQGYAKMLTMGIGGALNDTQTQFVQVINNNVDRMGKLVNDLLEISRLEAGRTHLKLAPVRIQEIVEETLINTRTEIEARHHTLQVEAPEDLPPVLGDRERLVQILTNLVSNAYKYTPQGGTIRIVVDGLDRASVPPGHVCIAVSDTGIGMSPQEIIKLEEKFFRADHDLVQQQPGTGLGVSITRNLVALHGGEFTVESEPGQGSTFSFTVPVALSPSEQNKPPRSAG
ncbi:MAG: GAF domain-containing protein [Anaerolineae bacterium]|nr:GAF domain-containing protein [Anaerolineae bacterium]